MQDQLFSTATHDYFILPTDRWDLAAELISTTFGPEFLSQLPSPDIAALLVAQNRESGELEGFMFLQTAVHAEPFGCTPGVGVSFSAFQQVVDSILPAGTVYHATAEAGARGTEAMQRAGFKPVSETQSLRPWVRVAGG